MTLKTGAPVDVKEGLVRTGTDLGRSGVAATTLTDIGPADRLLHLFCASTLPLGLLLVWEVTHERSCWALLAPGLVYVFVFWGLLAHRLERKTLRRRLR